MYDDSVKEGLMAENMLTIDQIEKEFGLKRSTVYRYVAKGKLIAHRRVGDRKAYFKREEVVELRKFKPRKRLNS
jgi:excisionase family DNA binding protein